METATVRISTRRDVWGVEDQAEANRAAQRLVGMIEEEFGCEPTLTDGESYYEYDEIERFADGCWVSCLDGEISTAAATLGRKGGAAKSDRKIAAARSNGKRGGRPADKLFRGRIVDAMTGDILTQTRRTTTWDEAQHKAEAALKRLGLTGDRYGVRVSTWPD